MRNITVCVLIAIVFSVVPMAQESRGVITGTVRDPQGSVIPNARIAARQTGMNIESRTTTNTAGVYVLPFLDIGAYTLTVTADGFKTVSISNHEQNDVETGQVDFDQELGATTDAVTVSP